MNSVWLLWAILGPRRGEPLAEEVVGAFTTRERAREARAAARSRLRTSRASVRFYVARYDLGQTFWNDGFATVSTSVGGE